MPKALLVADSEWVRNDVEASLSIGGWRIEVLTDPGRVVDVVESSSPDVVITDLQVAAMGGMAIIRAIRGSIPEPTRPRMILLLDRTADEFISRRAGADAAVVKPFSADALRTAVGPFPEEPLPEEKAKSRPVRKAAPKSK